MTNILQAHLCWDWPGPLGWHGRGEDGVSKEDGGTGVKAKGLMPLHPQHDQHVRLLMHAIIDSVQELLLIPRRGRMRHIHTPCGTKHNVVVCESNVCASYWRGPAHE